MYASLQTERTIAQKMTDSVKDYIGKCNLHFSYRETPFTLNVRISKKFFVDYSQQVPQSSTESPPLSPSLLGDSGVNFSTTHFEEKDKDEETTKLMETLEKKEQQTEILNTELYNLRQKLSELHLHIKNLNAEQELSESKHQTSKVIITDIESKLKNKELDNAELKKDIKVKEEEVKKKDKEIDDLSKELKEKDKRIAQQSKEITVKREEVKEKDERIAEQIKTITLKRDEAKKKDERIAKQSKEIEVKSKQGKEKDELIAEQSKEITVKSEQLKYKDERIAEQRKELTVEAEESAAKVRDWANRTNVETGGHSSISKKIARTFLNRQKHRKKVDALEPSFYLHAYKLANNGEFLWDDGTAWCTRVWAYKLRSARFYRDHGEGTLQEDDTSHTASNGPSL